MGAAAGTDLLSRMDAAPVSGRYWTMLTLIVVQLLTEMFDFFVASYLVSAVAPLWKLTFGQTTVMLLSAGVGAIVGAVLFGWLADRVGRTPSQPFDRPPCGWAEVAGLVGTSDHS